MKRSFVLSTLRTVYYTKQAVFRAIHYVDRLTTGPQSLPKRVLHIVRSSAPSFNSQNPVFSLTSSSNCLRLLLRLLVTPSLYLSFSNVS
jgi:Protein of unknown function (DUF1601).